MNTLSFMQSFPMKTRSQRLEPVPSFHFVDRREIDYVSVALDQLARSGEVDDTERMEFEKFRSAFKFFALGV